MPFTQPYRQSGLVKSGTLTQYRNTFSPIFSILIQVSSANSTFFRLLYSFFVTTQSIFSISIGIYSLEALSSLYFFYLYNYSSRSFFFFIAFNTSLVFYFLSVRSSLYFYFRYSYVLSTLIERSRTVSLLILYLTLIIQVLFLFTSRASRDPYSLISRQRSISRVVVSLSSILIGVALYTPTILLRYLFYILSRYLSYFSVRSTQLLGVYYIVALYTIADLITTLQILFIYSRPTSYVNAIALVSTKVYISIFFYIFLIDRKSTRLNSSHSGESRMPSSA